MGLAKAHALSGPRAPGQERHGSHVQVEERPPSLRQHQLCSHGGLLVRPTRLAGQEVSLAEEGALRNRDGTITAAGR